MQQHEHAMEKAILHADRATDTTISEEERRLEASLASTYVAMARELRIGTTKTGTYQPLRVDKPGAPVAEEELL